MFTDLTAEISASNIHLAVEAHGNPITFMLSHGTIHDVLRAHIKQAGCLNNTPLQAECRIQ